VLALLLVLVLVLVLVLWGGGFPRHHPDQLHHIVELERSGWVCAVDLGRDKEGQDGTGWEAEGERVY